MIDTGYGIGKGLALTRLFSEVKPTTITDVLITHCHPDHISGLTHNGEAAFPKAKVHIIIDNFTDFHDALASQRVLQFSPPLCAAVHSAADKLKK